MPTPAQPPSACPPLSPALLARQRVVRAADFDTWCNAEQLLQQAEAAAEGIRNAAFAEAQQRADEGFREGRAAGRAEYAERLATLELAAEQRWHEWLPLVQRLVLDCLTRLLGELSPAERWPRRLDALLAEIRPRGAVTLYAAPGAVPTVQQALLANPALSRTLDLVTVVADPKLGEDDLVLATPTDMVDGRLATQLAALDRAVAAVLAPAPPKRSAAAMAVPATI